MSRYPDAPDVPEIEAREAWERVSTGQAVVLDVRETYELREARIDQALHVPLGELPGALDRLPADKELLVLCHSGYRSAFATAYLVQAGYPLARNLVGGIVEWACQGLPLTLGSDPPRSG